MAVILYIVALFSADSVLTYVLAAAVLALCILVSKVPFKSLTKGLKPILIIVIFTAVMNLFSPRARLFAMYGCCGTSPGRAWRRRRR